MAILRVGTSGFAYKEWKGKFYPANLRDRDWLSYYSRQFPTVEINHTFYRMPTEKAVLGWSASVPGGFQFALKANQAITHVRKLRDCEALLRRFLEAASVLGAEEQLGPVLVQLPPNFRAQADVLESFLKLRPRAFRFALEFRHPSWFEPQVYDLLQRYQTALGLRETDLEPAPDRLTADFTYVRLRRNTYAREELQAWRQRFRAWVDQGVDVYVYVKHEDAAQGPAYARQLLGEAGAQPSGRPRGEVGKRT